MTRPARTTAHRTGTDPALVVLVFLVASAFGAGAVVGFLAGSRRAPSAPAVPSPVRLECVCEGRALP